MTSPSAIQLPSVPHDQATEPVAAWSEPVEIETYDPEQPDLFPAFLDRRVYQGSSGRVFPLPFHERIAAGKAPRRWQAVHLENRWVRVMILPELGGRIHIGYDKTAGYDFFYRNDVIKPALVGLAGPWVSGGVEFNWPQHHRPATFLPTDVEIEREPDGAVTVWCSDHDPFTRMKGMHGIRLRPDASTIEARVRLYNRTDDRQTFLWWANVAARVDDDYQSFFPPDVTEVADHARRAITAFPAPDTPYYGVDYAGRRTAERPDGDRLDWYRNIPVPTSYMVLSTRDEFFGGYDHGRDAGFVHWADRAVSPGKKQWTWGNAPSGWAWDANLTDDGGPYVELMAGVYTDNQPDFAFLDPGETKTFSQFWYPISRIGPVQQAGRDAAVRVERDDSGVHALVHPAVAAAGAVVEVRAGDRLVRRTVDLVPGVTVRVDLATSDPDAETTVVVRAGDRELVALRPRHDDPLPARSVAVEPPPPADVGSVEELYLIGSYLRQYRHATRMPEPYWTEALRRDPGDVRSLLALADGDLRAGLLDRAEERLRRAVGRLTAWVPTPVTGEAHYRLGVVLARRGRDTEADDVLARAAWDAAWRHPAQYLRARIAARRGDREAARELLHDILRRDREHLQAADLLAALLRADGRGVEAAALAEDTLALDPLDQWARDLAGRALTEDAPTLLDVAIDYADAGLDDDALRLLDMASAAASRTVRGQVQVGPVVAYHRAALLRRRGDEAGARAATAAARAGDLRWAAASRPADAAVLEAAWQRDPHDALAALLLGAWYYDRGRADDAVRAWRVAAAGDLPVTQRAIAERNLGIAAYNLHHDLDEARSRYDRAIALLPDEAKLRAESDQLDARRGVPAATRLAALEEVPELVQRRDDLVVALAGLLTATGRAQEARDLLASRRFQPWEGGEGQVLRAWEDAALALARATRGESAVALVRSAIDPPATLGEARHALANTARLQLALGDALAADGRPGEAAAAWEAAAASAGDFIGMSTRPYSEQTAASVRALRRLGREAEAVELMARWSAWLDELETTPARVDFFATSLPAMLLFVDDPALTRRREIEDMRGLLAGLHGDPTA